ncbi:MAG: hypothetical protein ACRDUS_10400, partial [Mycobacterium sp.]
MRSELSQLAAARTGTDPDFYPCDKQPGELAKEDRGSVRFGSVRFGSVRFGSVRFGSVRFGSVRFGSVRFGSVRFG